MGKRKGKEHEDRNRESVRKKESQCKKKTQQKSTGDKSQNLQSCKYGFR